MADLLQRLRDRKLVQWALAYLATAFALIQVLDVVAQRFGWSEQAERFVIVALRGDQRFQQLLQNAPPAKAGP